MIEWASPWAFWLLIPVLLLPLQSRLTGRNRLAVPGEGPMARAWTLRLALWWLPEVLLIAGLALSVVALARPQITHRDVVMEEDGLDIVLAIDTSGSMKTRDFDIGISPASRLEVAKGVIADFVEARPNDRIGLVVFGETAFTFVPLTLDHTTLVDALDYVQIGIAGGGKTAIGAAVAVSARRMKQIDSQERIVILLTDGRNNVLKPDPRQAAQAAAALNIKIYTIGIGSTGSRFFASEIDEALLMEVSKLTHAQYFRARTTDTLEAVYETIDQLETSPAEVRELVDEEQLFRTWLVPGFVLVFLSVLLSTTVLRRGP